MKRNRYKEIDDKAYEIFKFFKEKAREHRYGQIMVKMVMHDGYPVKIITDVSMDEKDGTHDIFLDCPIGEDKRSYHLDDVGEIAVPWELKIPSKKRKSSDNEKTEDSSEKKT